MEASSNIEPPTQTSYGVEQRPEIARPEPLVALPPSQPDAPLSPEETKEVIPCAAACCQRLLKKLFSLVPMADSQAPKLVLITGATLLLTMYCADRSTPSVVFVDLVTTNLIVAFFATAPDHSRSSSASPSSPESTTPGAVPLWTVTGSLAGRPK